MIPFEAENEDDYIIYDGGNATMKTIDVDKFLEKLNVGSEDEFLERLEKQGQQQLSIEAVIMLGVYKEVKKMNHKLLEEWKKK